MHFHQHTILLPPSTFHPPPIDEAQVAGVPRLHVVVEDILLLVVTLAGIDERVVERPVAMAKTDNGRAGVPGDVGYLVLIIRGGGVGDVAGVLVGVLRTDGRDKIATRIAVGLSLDIDALDVDTAQVEHRPAELLTFGIGHNFIVDGVVIGVEVHGCVTNDTPLKVLVQGEARVVLQGTLGHEVGIAHIGIVEVVERRHTEALLDVGTEREERAAERIDVDEDGGGEP